METKLQPKNSDFFLKLLTFAEEIFRVCENIGITPIVYGSMAYFYYTKDKNIEIHDLDLLVPESKFQKLTKLLEKENNLTFEKKPYHSIEVFKDGMEIDIDSIEHFLGTRSKEVNNTSIKNLKFQIINIETLIEMYKEALDQMPKLKKLIKKRNSYTKKLNNLIKLRKNNPKKK